jgi:hypothetical protein
MLAIKIFIKHGKLELGMENREKGKPEAFNLNNPQ